MQGDDKTRNQCLQATFVRTKPLCLSVVTELRLLLNIICVLLNIACSVVTPAVVVLVKDIGRDIQVIESC